MELSYLSLFTAFLAAGAMHAAVWVGARVGTLLQRHDDLPEMLTRVLEEKHLSMLKDLNGGLNNLADRLSATQTEAAERLRATVALELKQTRDALLVLQLSQTEELSASREVLVQKMGALAADVQVRQEGLRSDMQVKQEELRAGMQLKQEELRGGMQVKQEELRGAVLAKQDELRTELLTSVLQRLAEQARADQELMQTTLRNMSQHLSSAIEALTRTTDGRLEQISGKVSERLEEGFKKTNETF